MNLRPRKRSSPIIPIVALVDILVIVLLFIVATTTFKQSNTQMEITLPQSDSLGTPAPEQDRRKTLAITKDKRVVLDGSEVDPENLALALQEMKLTNPSARLELQADQDTPLGLLVKVWDALKAAGFPVKEVPARIQRASAS
ncbi:biopolymer transporter ExbD [Phragmitibacter flavus]|uniref:Biopolymer transporter ExbD n=1 Tax=Phragmitibacter flavus TaxID=2576071 RepID=A0A5R8KIH5_9BACT|nr:biopolymer transporter ExbD [Phragmitibacter flavus]TLD72118.1 biopolymer transporter ExbD [Phragmitibacter flavus]